jgi:type IV pilus assembly protein PilW
MYRSAKNGARGFSLVELMVAMLIGLIATIIIFQVFEVSEGIKRTTTTGGDAQQAGAISLYVLEQDLRNAGAGFNETPWAGCNLVGWDQSQSPQDFATGTTAMRMVPVKIITGGTPTTPDTISVFYGSQSLVVSATTLSANMTLATDPLHVLNRYGQRVGDLLLLLEPGSGKNCAFMEITSLPASPGDQINHDSAGTQRFNKSNGLGIVYAGANTANATRVFNLGNLYDASGVTLPVYNTYFINANTLMVKSALSQAPAATVTDNVVHMRAQYGVDDGVNDGTVTYNTTYAAGDGQVDRFMTGTPNWRYVIAVRFAVVTRSALPEKPSTGVGNACDTTTVAPTWSGGTFDLSASADPNPASPFYWTCYRYRVFETTVPLRNWIWRSS